MDYKKLFEKFGDREFFIKTSQSGGKAGLDSAQKVSLNRRGNVLFNQGDIEGARRIFITTGYSDGLCRIGDYYRSKGRLLDALRMYWIAPDHGKAEPIIIRLSELIRDLINEEPGNGAGEGLAGRQTRPGGRDALFLGAYKKGDSPNG
jgi:hypothetical protein